MSSKQKKHDRAWFEQKVGELGEAIRQLPDERQLKLFDKLTKPEDTPRERQEGNRKETDSY